MANWRGTWRVMAGLVAFWLVVLLYLGWSLLGLVAFWLVVLLYLGWSLLGTEDAAARTDRHLAKALHDLDQLKQQNAQLMLLADDLKKIKRAFDNGEYNKVASDTQIQPDEEKINLSDVSKRFDSIIINGEPSVEQEQLRRKSENGVVELWYYMRAELFKLKEAAKDSADLRAQIERIYAEGFDHKQTILVDLHNMSEVAGLGMWREKESLELGRLVQNRLHYLQNPTDCATAKKIVCNLNKGCGYGCQLHHLVYCFIVAYATERTFVLQSKGWRYSPSGWERFFLPLSQTCTDAGGASRRGWASLDSIKDIQVIELPIVDSMHPKPSFMPLAIPEDIGYRLTRLHGHPIVWWIGQFIAYLTRPQPGLALDMEQTRKKMGFRGPIVGVHVRRTDKVGTEAGFHAIDEYMFHVDEYFDLLERKQKVSKRRIFLATDDPKLLEETRARYPQYDVISDNTNSQTAGLSSRYSEKSLRGVIVDIDLLSRCNYLVCTFSSQVCRVAYEIMQTLHPDASAYFHSLDDIYYYGGQNGHDHIARYPFTALSPDHIPLRPGDRIGVAGNHWDGYSKGTNKKSGRSGLYPSYKVMDEVVYAKFPSYRLADEKLKKT